MLRMAAAIGLVAGLTLAYCLFFSAPVWAFMVAMGLVGAYKGFNNPPIESIFADSVQRGKRCCPCSRPILSISSLCHPSNALQVEHFDGVLSRAWLQAAGQISMILSHNVCQRLLLQANAFAHICYYMPICYYMNVFSTFIHTRERSRDVCAATASCLRSNML